MRKKLTIALTLYLVLTYSLGFYVLRNRNLPELCARMEGVFSTTKPMECYDWKEQNWNPINIYTGVKLILSPVWALPVGLGKIINQ